MNVKEQRKKAVILMDKESKKIFYFVTVRT